MFLRGSNDSCCRAAGDGGIELVLIPRCPVQMAVPQAAAGGSFARAVDAVFSDSYVPPVTPLQ